MLKGLIAMFYSQSASGIYICYFIGLITIAFIVYNYRLSTYYRNLVMSYQNEKSENPPNFSEKQLNLIYNDFITSVKDGTANVNTQVIILKNIPKKYIIIEYFINYASALTVVMGLLGTFIGLTAAIGKMGGILNQVDDMKNFISMLSDPLSDMATAFITSVCGIVGSVIINILEKVPALATYYYKQKFIDEMEDYLDNKVYAGNAENSDSVLIAFTKTVEESMKYMTDKVTSTFEEGVDKFVNKINVLSLDLRESSITLSNSINKLETCADMLKTPSLAYKESVDKFKGISDSFTGQLDMARNIVQEMRESFDMTIDAFNENKDALITMSGRMEETTNSLGETLKNLMHITDGIKTEQSKMTSLNGELNITITNLNSGIREMSSNVSKQLKDTLEENLTQMAKITSHELSQSLLQFKNQNDYFETNMELFRKRLDTYQNMIEETTGYLSEVAASENKD